MSTVRRSGRPPGTSARELELAAMRLFAEEGYEDTTVAQIAAAAGVSGRTFFRYYESKADVLWGAFDDEVASIRAALAGLPAELPVMTAVRRAVLAVNDYRQADVPELRLRMTLIGGRPELAASAAAHYEAWEQAVRDFVAQRSGQPPDSLYPLAVGRATLATCRAAYERPCRRWRQVSVTRCWSRSRQCLREVLPARAGTDLPSRTGAVTRRRQRGSSQTRRLRVPRTQS
jgi:mycofactocin system transcriptional regulator